MVKDIMKKFTSPGPWSLLGKTGFLTLGLMVLVVLAGNTGRAQFTFSSAQVLALGTGERSAMTIILVANGPRRSGAMPDFRPMLRSGICMDGFA